MYLRVWLYITETMEDWDEDQLRDVVNKKHGEHEKSLPKTTIVSIASIVCIVSSVHIL